jgi:hypothetical protein
MPEVAWLRHGTLGCDFGDLVGLVGRSIAQHEVDLGRLKTSQHDGEVKIDRQLSQFEPQQLASQRNISGH